MGELPYLPVYELTRGETVESIHFGSIAVVDARGKLLAWYGNPDTITFLRSTAKPFQALPFFEKGGAAYYKLSLEEIALTCSSHSGTDQHVAVVRTFQEKAGLTESDLLCGVHEPMDEVTAQALRSKGEEPTPYRHNCSGKHTGMLAYRNMLAAQPGSSPLDYIDTSHPIQIEILSTFAEMCGLTIEQVRLGIDGCSAPNFAIPLRNAALGYARLCDPINGKVLPDERARACQLITSAMIANPGIIAGPGRLDTLLMKTARGRLISKGGAEGYHGIGILPGVLAPDAPGIGIAMKISDGDLTGRADGAVVLEVLMQLGVLERDELLSLASFGPVVPIHNWREIVVGEARPSFELVFNS